jgi:hypothetical protein
MSETLEKNDKKDNIVSELKAVVRQGLEPKMGIQNWQKS